MVGSSRLEHLSRVLCARTFAARRRGRPIFDLSVPSFFSVEVKTVTSPLVTKRIKLWFGTRAMFSVRAEPVVQSAACQGVMSTYAKRTTKQQVNINPLAGNVGSKREKQHWTSTVQVSDNKHVQSAAPFRSLLSRKPTVLLLTSRQTRNQDARSQIDAHQFLKGTQVE